MQVRNVIKFLLGISLAIAILISGGVATALYFLHRVTTHPPKPIFVNDTAEVKVRGSNVTTATNPTTPSSNQSNSASSTPEASSTTVAPGTYRARVTWAQGLSVRSEPNQEAERIAGAAYNEELTVLETSSDKSWQRIRLENSEQEGWIKAGNIERIEE